MTRRRALLAAAGLAAVVGGAGTAWWRARPPAADAALWTMQFDMPDGAPLRLAALRGRPLLLNFWATWCPPCVTELPLLDAFQRHQPADGWRVVGLAVDSPEPVRQFLARRPVGFAIGLVGLDGVELARSLGNGAGALPFTVAFDRRGSVLERKLGAITARDLQRWAERSA